LRHDGHTTMLLGAASICGGADFAGTVISSSSRREGWAPRVMIEEGL